MANAAVTSDSNVKELSKLRFELSAFSNQLLAKIVNFVVSDIKKEH